MAQGFILYKRMWQGEAECLTHYTTYSEAVRETVAFHTVLGNTIVGLHSDPLREEAEFFVIRSDKSHSEYTIRPEANADATPKR